MKRSTSFGLDPSVEVLPLNWICAFQYQSSKARPSSASRARRRLKELDSLFFWPLYVYCTMPNPESFTLLIHFGTTLCALAVSVETASAAMTKYFFMF